MTLADLFNSPSEFEFEGVVYKLRQPTLIECGQYQRWLEQEARAGAARATELDEADRRNLLRDVQADIAAKRYAWGGELCVQSLRTPDGIAKLTAIICADQGMTEATAKKAAEQRLWEIAAVIAAAQEEEQRTGKANPQLRELLARLGLRPDFLSTSSSDSATNPTDEPPTSSPSDSSA